MKFRDLFSNDFETKEDHYIPELRTRYYRSMVDDAKNAVLSLIEAEHGTLKDITEPYNEYYFHTPGYTCIVTVTGTRIGETAIDIKVTTYKVFPNGAGKKIIERMYKYLDSKLPFKGVSLYRG